MIAVLMVYDENGKETSFVTSQRLKEGVEYRVWHEEKKMIIEECKDDKRRKVNGIFEDIDNLDWYHVDKHGEVVEGSSSDYETFYRAKDIFDVLSQYGYEDYDSSRTD